MDKLSTSYLGLHLKSPLIVSSSNLTSKIENIRIAEESGAGAVVLKSLFEEQIMYNVNELSDPKGYPEADEYISSYVKAHSVESYLKLIKDSKKTISIPVIASINCFTSGVWIDFSEKIQDAGADALEINAFFMPVDKKKNAIESEKQYLDLIEKITDRVKIPIVMKIGMRFSNILNIVDKFYSRGIKGVVMFNRFYEPDIDIEKEEIKSAPVFSDESELRYVLRWVAMTSGMGLKMNISASTGVKKGDDVIKYILAGADTVQVCSALYVNGIPYLKKLNERLKSWMDQNNYKDISQFRGKLNWKNTKSPLAFERTQFIKYFSSID
ncbi:MAG TPA: dihydroorotate dehydrogenase-like protein [Bacteroidales bacterium]|nr:dihydroorotate dehydrogenase-like protein [Bacteroidales bacterium]